MLSEREQCMVISFRVPPSQVETLNEVAVREGISRGEILRSMVRRVAAERSTAFLFGAVMPNPAPAE